MNVTPLRPKAPDRREQMNVALAYFGIHHDQDKVLALLGATLLYRDGKLMMERDRPHLETLFGGKVFE
jgi:hypothetical protein